ncbi:hypothetical protein Taro_011781 [Colocasia esculenta]|uniref:Uncharacterized protein n=1 Tax=Colocasia esculenta TaxID=4460 RepID=A0A843UDQ3_COLES|nr:hypothetical protein [Colocasia esculenta]
MIKCQGSSFQHSSHQGRQGSSFVEERVASDEPSSVWLRRRQVKLAGWWHVGEATRVFGSSFHGERRHAGSLASSFRLREPGIRIVKCYIGTKYHWHCISIGEWRRKEHQTGMKLDKPNYHGRDI